MKILLTNDDGINAPGIFALRKALFEIADVTVVAPETEMSAVGHAITLTDPLRVRKIMSDGALFGYAVNGTPADCVKIAIRAILPDPPDMVVSGINHGQNVATNIIYSGTVSAATEGMILGIPSVAVSLGTFAEVDFSVAAKKAIEIIGKIANIRLPEGSLVNVNIPALPEEELKGIKICPMGCSRFKEVFEKRVDPRGVDYYWQGGAMEVDKRDEKSDIAWLDKGYITVTPIHFDLTNYEFMTQLETAIK